MNSSRCVAVLMVAAMLAVAFPVPAQVTPAPAQSATLPATPSISQELLDSLLAPIALYPDQLLTQILMASTYPLEVVEAARFVKANPNLKGAALDDALKDKTWDASVLSLAAFPQILDMMNDKLEWTQRLGDAFLDDEEGVMRTVQSLRWRAQEAGNLRSTEQQNVVVQERTILIEPAQPQYIYVPVYDPTVIYGPWWVPAYRPWFWYPPPIWGYPPYYGGAVAAGFFWGTAWAITANNWGWCRPNWRGGSININVNNNNIWVNRPQYRDRYPNNSNWNHNVEHRRGVAYRDTATGNKYRPINNAGVQTRESYRGRDNVTRPAPGTVARPAPSADSNLTRPAPGTVNRPAPSADSNLTRPAPGTVNRPAPSADSNLTRPAPGTVARPAPSPDSNLTRPAPSAENRTRPTPKPMFASPPSPSGSRPTPAYQPESRPQVQRDANRGAQSRATMQPPAPSVNRGGGGVPGGGVPGGGVPRGSAPGGIVPGGNAPHGGVLPAATLPAAAFPAAVRPAAARPVDRVGVTNETWTRHHERHPRCHRRARGSGALDGRRVVRTARARGRPGARGSHPACLRARYLRVAGGSRQGSRRRDALR